MKNEKSKIKELIDAAVNNPLLARDLIRTNQELKVARYIHNETSVHFLAVEGKTSGVELLCSLGVDPNEVNEFGDSPLMDIVRLGNHEIAEILLKAGANPNFNSDTYGTLLEIAEENKDSKMIDLLKRYGAV